MRKDSLKTKICNECLLICHVDNANGNNKVWLFSNTEQYIPDANIYRLVTDNDYKLGFQDYFILTSIISVKSAKLIIIANKHIKLHFL